MGRDALGSTLRDVATLPNAITIARLALVVPIAWLILADAQPVLTVVLLIVFGASDWVDGHLARRLGQVSGIGTVLDPAADRIGITVIVLSLALAGHLPLWVLAVVAGVDVALAAIYLIRGRPTMSGATWIGKIRTAVLMTGLALVGLALVPALSGLAAVGRPLCMVGAVLHAAAGIGYAREMIVRPREQRSEQ